jgi:rhodanese-related sulfurtransferase
MREVVPSQLEAWLKQASPPLLLDVREPWEFHTCRIGGSVLIPMSSIVGRAQELDPERPTVVVCHHGVRSLKVALYLERSGFSDVINLSGGVAAWATQVDPQIPKY